MFTPSVYQIRQQATLTRRLFGPVRRSTVFLILFFMLLATFLYSGSSASSFRAKSGSHQPKSVARSEDKSKGELNNSAKAANGQLNTGTSATAPASLSAALFLPPQVTFTPETITTYDGTCTNLKSDFHFGDTVCAKIEGGIPLSISSRRFSWVNPYNEILSRSDVTTLPQTDVFVIPPRDFTNDNRGVWRVNSISSRSSVRASAFFNVSDPDHEAANVLVYDNINTDASTAANGSNIEFALWVSNQGPNAATNVQLVDSVSGGATFSTTSQDSGPAFSCSPSAGGTTCTIASLAVGASARIRVVYQVSGSAGTGIVNTATISSDTPDQFPNNNTSVAQLSVTGGGGGSSCSLGCPGNIVKAADATQGSDHGSFVTFGAGETSGDCGTVTATPASGTFFAVGTTTVTLSSSSGESCSFNVTVTEGDTAPTISCPANVQKDAGSECSVVVPAADLSAPTATGTGVTVDGTRSDNLELDAPYPVGTTTIVWVATDSSNRTASCQQTVTVTGTDTTPPTLNVPPDVTDTTGATGASCGKIVGETELGTATADDNCSTATVTRSGVPAGSFFPIGETTITYTAKDGAGNTTTATQKVTITDNTPPVIKAPADASYTCLSEVPAADPSQATSGDVFDSNGNLLPPAPPSDNCGVPTVTVSETSSGAGSASSPRIITRTFTATDAAGNTASDAQTITVTDSTPPTIQAPGDVSVNTGPGAASCDATVSNATLGTASATDNCSVVTVTRSPSGNTFPVGTTNVIWTATDAAGNTATSTQHVTVTDNTAPTITAPADKTLYTGAGATSCDVTVSNLDATLGTATASDNCGSVTVVRGGGSVFPLGETLVTYTATDSHGNTATATQKVTVVDNTPPVVTPPANITVQLPLNSSATSMTVTYPNPATATDNCAGTITFSYSPASGSTFNVGPTTVTVTATDAHGNSATATFTVTVLYNFTGFFSPVGNLPVLNVVNAGRAIPVKFSLSGNKGLSIFTANNPYSVAINCDTTAPAADVTETLTAGGSSLSYSPDQYNYVWKTDSSWAGTCRQLTVTLNDGSVHKANFKFK